MARISLSRHWKFRRVARAVGTTYAARGLLELVWEAAYEAANEYIGTPADIADAAGWTGEPVELVAILLEAELLDERAPGEYVIHDLWDHVPTYVKLRWTRANPDAPPPWHREAKAKTGADRPPIANELLHPCDKIALARPVPSRPVKKEQRRSASRSLPLKKPNVHLIVRLGHEIAERYELQADRADALKTICAKHNVPFDARSITLAMDRLWTTRQPKQRRTG